MRGLRLTNFALGAALLTAASSAAHAQGFSPWSYGPSSGTSTILGLPLISCPNGTEVLPLDQGQQPSIVTGHMPLGALAAYSGQCALPLSGAATIPSGSHQINAAPGAVLTLPNGALPGTVEIISDYQQGAQSNSITVNPSSDGAILERSPYTLTINNESMGFRKQPSGAWQPF